MLGFNTCHYLLKPKIKLAFKEAFYIDIYKHNRQHDTNKSVKEKKNLKLH